MGGCFDFAIGAQDTLDIQMLWVACTLCLYACVAYAVTSLLETSVCIYHSGALSTLNIAFIPREICTHVSSWKFPQDIQRISMYQFVFIHGAWRCTRSVNSFYFVPWNWTRHTTWTHLCLMQTHARQSNMQAWHWGSGFPGFEVVVPADGTLQIMHEKQK